MSSDVNRVRLRHTNPEIDILIQDAYNLGTDERTIRDMVPHWERMTSQEVEKQTRRELGLPPQPQPKTTEPKPEPELSELEQAVRREMGLRSVKVKK